MRHLSVGPGIERFRAKRRCGGPSLHYLSLFAVVSVLYRVFRDRRDSWKQEVTNNSNNSNNNDNNDNTKVQHSTAQHSTTYHELRSCILRSYLSADWWNISKVTAGANQPTNQTVTYQLRLTSNTDADEDADEIGFTVTKKRVCDYCAMWLCDVIVLLFVVSFYLSVLLLSQEEHCYWLLCYASLVCKLCCCYYNSAHHLLFILLLFILLLFLLLLAVVDSNKQLRIYKSAGSAIDDHDLPIRIRDQAINALRSAFRYVTRNNHVV